jgi:co-chaperonin GroES (HSP10)
MKAIGNYIIVTDKEVVQKNSLGLIISEGSDQNIRYIEGTVISVGDLVKSVEVGDQIYFDKVAGSKIRLRGQKYIAIREGDVVVTLGDADSVI